MKVLYVTLIENFVRDIDGRGFIPNIDGGFVRDIDGCFILDIDGGFIRDIDGGFIRDIDGGFILDINRGFIRDIYGSLIPYIDGGFIRDIYGSLIPYIDGGFIRDIDRGFIRDIDGSLYVTFIEVLYVTLIEALYVTLMEALYVTLMEVPPIVNNKNNGVDVDKWDYFIRDSHACGFPNNFDKERALSVLRDQINLYNMFNLRYTLHSKVYQHLVVKCVEEINSVSTKECRGIEALKNYCLMDDRLLYLSYHANDKDTENNLQHARAIMDRIHQRDFYHCIYKLLLDSSEKEKRIREDCKFFEKRIREDKEKIEKEIATRIKTNPHNVAIEFEKVVLKYLTKSLKVDKQIKYLLDDYNIPTHHFIVKPIFIALVANGDFVIEHEEPKKSPMVPSKFEEVTLRVFCTLKHCDRIQLETQIESYFDECNNVL
ncbi:hypothetical protein KUTeg_015266 [Tegillarca granosa]|uniref:Uncharacterized protein n=1 Tax=Tegillarca granosa TaxID=220873 RepID=A0ABQ9EUC2_TEGGR|nr:hypothetical protein KUTeg_015266 [Tegillarca granosa]